MTTNHQPANNLDPLDQNNRPIPDARAKHAGSIGQQLAALPGNLKASLVIQALGLDLAGKEGVTLLRQSTGKTQKPNLLADLPPELISDLLVEFSGALKKRASDAGQIFAEKPETTRDKNQAFIKASNAKQARSAVDAAASQRQSLPGFAADIAAEHPIIGAFVLMDFPTEVVTRSLREMQPKNAQRIALCTADLKKTSKLLQDRIRILIKATNGNQLGF